MATSAGNRRVTITNTAGTRDAGVDDLKGALTSIDTDHHEIHSGDAFNAHYYLAAVTQDGQFDLRIAVGATEIHATFAGQAGGDAVAYLIEAPEFSNTGTAVTVFNRYRASSNTSGTTVSHTPTIGTAGTELFARMMPGGTGPKAIGASAATRDEWILKANTEYLARITNLAAAVVNGNIAIDWYE